jgi:GT2 family glycosyltransferase
MADRSGRAPTVTVIIPARDATGTLGAQLDALASQSYPESFEVIVADNGSVDGTADLVREHADRAARAGRSARVGGGPRFRVVEASGRTGQAYARNLGAEVAEGELLAFCDADDVVASTWLDALVAAAGSYDAVTGPLLFARSLSPAASFCWYGYEQDGMSRTQLGDTNDFLPYASSANLAIWRSAFRELGGFDEAMPPAEDKEFSWRLQLAGRRLGYAPAAVVNYRLRASPRAFARQQFNYARGETWLYTRFRAEGMARRPPSLVAKSWLRLALVDLPRAHDPMRRGELFRLLVRYAGRISGSLSFRTLYL